MRRHGLRARKAPVLRFLLFLMLGNGLPATARAQAGETDMKIVTFGTSLTARGGWQQPLQDRLAACLKRSVRVATVARSGATSDWGVAHIRDVAAERPDFIVIEFYANDASLQRFFTVSQSRANLHLILDGLKREAPQARILLQVMNPFSGLRGLMRPFLDSYIDAHGEEGRAQGATLVDHRPGWAALGQEALAANIPDGAHPDPATAARIIVPTLARVIGGEGC